MRIAESFVIDASAEVVFDYLTNPSNVPDWQTSKTSVEQLTDGPPRLGTCVWERTTRPGGKEFEQTVEFTEFDRPRRFRAHVVEGPYPIDGIWSLEPDGRRTNVSFIAEGELRGVMQLLGPIAKRLMARQFAGYHRNLARNIQSA